MSAATSFTEIGRRVAIWTFFMSVGDTAFVIGATVSGVKLPAFAYFAPPSLINYLYNVWQSTSSMQFTNLFAFFLFVLAPTVFATIVNLIVGILAGLVMIGYAIYQALAPIPFIAGIGAAIMALLTFLQATAIFYIIYVFFGTIQA